MKASYAVMLTHKGGPEALKVVELPMQEPGPGEVRVRTLATGVGATDITMRRGFYPYAPKIPFLPGYESVGIVDAVGSGVKNLKEGDRVCALLVYGGYATHIVRGADQWIKVPDELDEIEVIPLLLNYATAYQMLHRVANLQPGQWVLVNAANGGVGQALLDLARAHGVSAIGAAAHTKHNIVTSYGATPIEGRSLPLDIGVHKVRPEGVEAAFDGVGSSHTWHSLLSTAKNGVTVWYGFSGVKNTIDIIRSSFSIFLGSRLLGRRGSFYGITMQYRKNPNPYREDLLNLFTLLSQRKISPRIAQKFPLLDARKANEMIEGGGVDGKIVLVA